MSDPGRPAEGAADPIDGRGGETGPTVAKRPYAPPRLVRYGSIARITYGGMGNMSDGAPGRTKSCL